MITNKIIILFFHVILFFSHYAFPQIKVVGYYPDWIKSALLPNQIKFENLTHIIHAFAWPLSTGEISMYQGMPGIALINAAHNSGKKILLAFGGWGNSDGFAPMAADSLARARFIDNVANIVIQNEFDGIDLDWEFPADIGEGKNQTRLIEELRERFNEIDSTLLISMAVSAGSFYGQFIEYEKIVGEIDWFSMMGYDFHGSWTEHAGHNAPLYQPLSCSDGSVDGGIKYLTITRSVPKDKLLLGVPFYGKEFNSTGLYQSQTGNSTDLLFSEIAQRLTNNNWEYLWDDFSKVPYLLDMARTKFLTFDDTSSIRMKCEYVLNNQLAGIMIWALGQDLTGNSQPLLETIGRSAGFITSINPGREIISDFHFSENYPNPFNPSTIIKFTVPMNCFVTLTVVDMFGKEIEKLVERNMISGTYYIEFNASGLSSGVYFYTLTADGFAQTRKMNYLK